MTHLNIKSRLIINNSRINFRLNLKFIENISVYLNNGNHTLIRIEPKSK